MENLRESARQLIHIIEEVTDRCVCQDDLNATQLAQIASLYAACEDNIRDEIQKASIENSDLMNIQNPTSDEDESINTQTIEDLDETGVKQLYSLLHGSDSSQDRAPIKSDSGYQSITSTDSSTTYVKERVRTNNSQSNKTPQTENQGLRNGAQTDVEAQTNSSKITQYSFHADDTESEAACASGGGEPQTRGNPKALAKPKRIGFKLPRGKIDCAYSVTVVFHGIVARDVILTKGRQRLYFDHWHAPFPHSYRDGLFSVPMSNTYTFLMTFKAVYPHRNTDAQSSCGLHVTRDVRGDREDNYWSCVHVVQEDWSKRHCGRLESKQDTRFLFKKEAVCVEAWTTNGVWEIVKNSLNLYIIEV